MEMLTKRQSDVLDVIKKFMSLNSYPPSIREIANIMNLSSPSTIQEHLEKLEEKGYIKRHGKMNRTIELLTNNEYKINQTLEIPLLGKVTAGTPIEAIENPDEYFSVPYSLANGKKELFALNVDGESMINAGIFDNDIVIIERTSVARNGEIVVAMNDDNEVTIKRFYKEKNYFRLQPENDYMEPIILDNVTILGKLVGLYRFF